MNKSRSILRWITAFCMVVLLVLFFFVYFTFIEPSVYPSIISWDEMKGNRSSPFSAQKCDKYRDNTVTLRNGIQYESFIHPFYKFFVGSERIILYESISSLQPKEDNGSCLSFIEIRDEMVFEFNITINSLCINNDNLCIIFQIGNISTLSSQINSRFPAVFITNNSFYISFTNIINGNPYLVTDTLNGLLLSLSLDTMYTFKIKISQSRYTVVINGINFYDGEYPKHNTGKHALYINTPWYPSADIDIHQLTIYYINNIDESDRVVLMCSLGIGLMVIEAVLICAAICYSIIAYFKHKSSAKEIINWKELKSEIEENTQFITNPLVIFYGIEWYEMNLDKMDKPEIDGYIKNLNGIDIDYNNIKKWCNKMHFEFYPKKLKLEWSEKEILDSLQSYSAIFASSENNFDALLVITSGHGINNCIITSDRKTINKASIHRAFSINYPQIRHIPRIFIFDACDGDQERSYYPAGYDQDDDVIDDDIDGDDSKENNKNVTFNDDKIKWTKQGKRDEIWKKDELNPDYKCIQIHAANTGFIAKLDSEKGSLLIESFINGMNTAIDNEKDIYFGDIMDDIQYKLHHAGKQQITPLYNNNTRWLIFSKGTQLKCNKGHKLIYKIPGYLWICDCCNSLDSKTCRSFHCKQCGYDICGYCNDDDFGEERVTKLQCMNNHPLQYQLPNKQYSCFLLNYSYYTYSECDKCHTLYGAKRQSFHCVECGFSICIKCQDKKRNIKEKKGDKKKGIKKKRKNKTHITVKRNDMIEEEGNDNNDNKKNVDVSDEYKYDKNGNEKEIQMKQLILLNNDNDNDNDEIP